MGVPARQDTGIRVPVSAPTSETANVLTDVVLRRHQQIAQWGHNDTMPDGTGPDVHWSPAMGSATFMEEAYREDYTQHAQSGQPLTWMHILREEVAELFCEDDPAKLYTELMDVAAVAVSWAEKIRQR
jgi:hypothetical protein